MSSHKFTEVSCKCMRNDWFGSQCTEAPERVSKGYLWSARRDLSNVHSAGFILPRLWLRCHTYLCKKQWRYWILCRTERRQVETLCAVKYIWGIYRVFFFSPFLTRTTEQTSFIEFLLSGEKGTAYFRVHRISSSLCFRERLQLMKTRPKWHLRIAQFVQTTVQNSKMLTILSYMATKSCTSSIYYAWDNKHLNFVFIEKLPR